MYKQSVRANGRSLPAIFVSCILSLFILAVLKHRTLNISPTQYDLAENIVLTLNIIFILWLLFISRTEYMYQLIDHELIIRKIRGRRESVRCSVSVSNIISIRPISGIALLKSWWMRSIGYCGDPFAFFSSYVLCYKTVTQKKVMFVFQPNGEMVRTLSAQLGEKAVLTSAHMLQINSK